MISKVTIHENGQSRCETFEAPMLIGKILHMHDIPVDQPCGGRGKCGKCRVQVKGAVSPMKSEEARFLSEEEIKKGVRLACMTTAEGDFEMFVKSGAKENILTNFRLPEFSGARWSEGYGLAVDIGTTTLEAYLYDAKSALPVSVASVPNPQRAFGADVISRLKHAMEVNSEELRTAITEALGGLAKSVLSQAGKDESELKFAVVTGNTAMLYLLTGTPVESIAFAPFIPVTKFGEFVQGETIGLPKGVKVWLPDCVSSYVGADITCAMLPAGLSEKEEDCKKEAVLLADIGTNGEMALMANGGIYTTSTAAGPAFEGAGIYCGMTAQAGAIQKVDVKDGKMTWSVIGGGEAKGICGSGLVDVIAALLECGVIDETGYMEEEDHIFEDYMVDVNGQAAFRFPGTEVVLTQADVRTVQLAKAAICAGMLVLMKSANIEPEDVAHLKIAGGFGSYIRPESAEKIGLIPEGFAKKAKAIGNAAGAGAAMMLLSDDCRRKGTAISRFCQPVELSSNPEFSDCYIDCMAFE